jgi:hypothetical protein
LEDTDTRVFEKEKAMRSKYFSILRCCLFFLVVSCLSAAYVAILSAHARFTRAQIGSGPYRRSKTKNWRGRSGEVERGSEHVRLIKIVFKYMYPRDQNINKVGDKEAEELAAFSLKHVAMNARSSTYTTVSSVVVPVLLSVMVHCIALYSFAVEFNR